MKYLIYLSTAVDLLDEQEIHNLLAKSRARNASNDITGILLYHEGNFIQLLEGEQAKVDETLERIAGDPSHKNIIVIDEGDLDERNFGAWSMGYQKATAKELADIEAYTDPQKLEQASGSHPALSILKTFVKTNLG
ncbi:BLUF domain-containing protein [Mucilaginibacter pedocola]|uniref:BLUF domain-containing protein n=1 Tax=Mucilaginibacter pedocola TaxID=1792845 RepID=A0A1S9PLJ4_9SPHI|nr:BLUF domain-containing protein [Mucilaginibacter pedocola]OOQ61418.1 hypothetical protein BC343_20845 [Mucilaginibacter pedocola]